MKSTKIFRDKINRNLAILIIITGAFYIYLAAQIPYTHDDWDWGLSNGIEQLLTASINSRYSGNLLEVLMTRSSVFKSIFMGSVFCALPIFLAIFAAKKREQIVPIAICANIMLLLIPQVIWQQTYGWIAGFANYVTSALWVMIFFCLSKGLFQKDAPLPKGRIKAVAVALFCVSMQLFAENITVFMLGVSLVFWVAALVKWRKLSGYYTALLVGCLLGTIVMFSSSMYGTLLQTGQAIDGYRELTFDMNAGALIIIQSFIVRFFTGFFPGVYGYYDGVYCLIIGILTVVLGVKNKKRFAMVVSVSGTAILAAVYYLPKLVGAVNTQTVVGVNVVFFLSIFLAVITIFWRDKTAMLKLCGIWLAAPLVMVPLVVINTVGERSFLMSLVFLVMFACTLLAELNLQKSTLLSAILLLPMLYWGIVYTEIGTVNRERMRLIEEASTMGAETVILPAFPHEEYLWQPDPRSDYRKKYYRLFYGLDENVEIIIDKGGV